MADIVYTVNQDLPENISGFEQYSEQDRNLVNSFQINSVFDPNKNYCELHILSLSDELLESTYTYSAFKQLGNAQSAGQSGASVLTIDPIEDSKAYGYTGGGVKLLYHFLNDLYSKDKNTVDFYIQDISADRTEISLASLTLSSQDLINSTSAIKSALQGQSYFTGFRLNFKDNDLLIATNIDTLDSPTGKVVVVKLYEPLPDIYTTKSTLNIVDLVSDSVAYEVDSDVVLSPEPTATLDSPNFNIDISDYSVIPTGYYNYNELFSYPINNSNSQIFSTVKEKGIDVSVDYADYSNFIHFSSAQERLLNFKYKLDLVTSYSASLSALANTTAGAQGVSGSREYYQNLMTGVVNNFDHYERFLYYESGSSSWPKSNSTKPYENKESTSAEAITWYANETTNAIAYDRNNYSSLIYSIPTFLRDDDNNQNYLTFIHMVGQHFDNLWLYSKAVTDKYDADNRMNHGISKDLVGEALKNFGVKLYTSNKSIEDLFTTFIGQAYQSGSEVINNYITGSLTGSNASIQPTSYDNYEKEVQKRIYHNLPLLLKSKGTERGLRALINCFGIAGDLLDIKLYGGRNVQERPFFGDNQSYSSSLDKIRLDNTGSIVTGSTLSQQTSIVRRDNKYTDDLHVVEVGFAPIDNVDNYIIANITGSFNMEDYIGDPGYLASSSYQPLDQIATTVLSGSLGTAGHYDLQDYVRLIKFYDNTIFKMVKDFIPARAVADTGIIIKPNLLNRSKAKSVTVIGTRPEHSASIDTAFISGSNAKSFGIEDRYNTAYFRARQTPLGVGYLTDHLQQQPKFDGEFSGSGITVSTQDLNVKNIYKYPEYTAYPYNVHYWSGSTEFCFLPTSISSFFVSPIDAPVNFYSVFPGNNANTQLTLSSVHQPTITITSPWTIPAYGTPFEQYEQIYVTASNGIVDGAECSASVSMTYGICEITNNTATGTQVVPATPYDLSTWFTINPVHTHLTYYITGAAVPTGIDVNTTAHPSATFPGTNGDTVTLQVVDTYLQNCLGSVSLTLGVCTLGVQTPPPPRQYFSYNKQNPSQRWFEKGETPITAANPIPAKRGYRSYFYAPEPSTLYTVRAVYANISTVAFLLVDNQPNQIKTLEQMLALAAQAVLTSTGEEIDDLNSYPIFILTANVPGISGCVTGNVLVCPRSSVGCFVKGTLVTMADGSYLPIEAVQEGDVVLTYNEETGEQQPGTVTEFKVYTKDSIVKLSLSNGTTIQATAEHPFWIVDKGWCSVDAKAAKEDHGIEVSQLEIGDTLLDENNNKVVLAGIEEKQQVPYQAVYNLTVQQNHTYYANGILVHNKYDEMDPIDPNVCYYDADGNVIFCTSDTGTIENTP